MLVSACCLGEAFEVKMLPKIDGDRDGEIDMT